MCSRASGPQLYNALSAPGLLIESVAHELLMLPCIPLNNIICQNDGQPLEFSITVKSLFSERQKLWKERDPRG